MGLFDTFYFFCNNCGTKNIVRADWIGAWGRNHKTCNQDYH